MKASGAQNRKRKKEENQFISSLPKLSSFLAPAKGNNFPGGACFKTADAASKTTRNVFWRCDSSTAPLHDTEMAGPAAPTSEVVDDLEESFELELTETPRK